MGAQEPQQFESGHGDPRVAALYADVSALATPAGRKPGTPGHTAAQEHVESRLAEIGLAPYDPLNGAPTGFRHRFRASDGLNMANLIGVLPGSDRDLPPIVIGAHYDSVITAPSADDNAAAVAVALEVASTMARASARLRRDVVFAIFDAEEPPYFWSADMGSTRFVEDVAGPVHLAVIMDLIGHPLALPGFPLDPDILFVTGAESHPALPGMLRGLRTPIVATANRRVGDMSDQRAFRLSGAPFLFFSCGEWDAYHSPRDRIDGLDFTKMSRLVADLLTLLASADETELAYDSAHDATAFEVGTMERAFGGETLLRLAQWAGRESYTQSADLDVMVTTLRALLQGYPLPGADVR